MRCFALEQYGLGDCVPRAGLPVRPSGQWVNYHDKCDMNLVYLSTFGFHVIGEIPLRVGDPNGLVVGDADLLPQVGESN